jgi:intracellular multiplication protein IcmC
MGGGSQQRWVSMKSEVALMLPNKLRCDIRGISNFFWVLFILACFSMPAYAQESDYISQLAQLTPQAILVNISKAIPNLMRLVTALAYVMGMLFIIRGLLKLKHVGEMRSMMSHEHHLGVPITYFFIGGMLLYIPSAVNVGLSTFWTDPAPYAYVEKEGQWVQLMNVFWLIIQLIGTIAFIRGLLILSRSGGGHHQGGMSKALTHIIGGLFCINIYQFIQVVMATIGIET